MPFVASFSGFACKLLLSVILFRLSLFDWKLFIASKLRVFVGSEWQSYVLCFSTCV